MAYGDEVKTRVTVDADDAVRDLNRVSGATEKMGRETREAGREAADASRDVDSMTGALKILAGLFAGGQALQTLFDDFTRAVEANSQALRENAEAAAEAAKSQLDLQFLNERFSIEERGFVENFAAFTGESQEQAAASIAQFRSATAHLSKPQQDEYLRQLAETKVGTSGTSASLVPLFARGSRFFKDDPEVLQALMREAQKLSPVATPQFLADRVGILGIGEKAGLTPAQTIGLLTTSLAVDEASGETSLRNIISILGGGGHA